MNKPMRQLAPGVYEDEFGEFHVAPDEIETRGVGEDDDDFGADDAEDALDGLDDDATDHEIAAVGEAIGRVRNPRRQARLNRRFNRKLGRLRDRAGRKGVDLSPGRGKKDPMQTTAENASFTLSAAGTFAATVIPQYDFNLTDITFDAPSGTTVSEIKAGDRVLWSSSSGIPMSMFSSTSFKQGLIKGGHCRAGLTLRVTFTATATSGVVNCVFLGEKPGSSC